METQEKYSYNVKESTISFHKDTNTFVALASSLRLSPGEWPEVIELRNEETGNSKKFIKTKPYRNNGELTHYIYVPADLNGFISAFSDPEDAELKLKIFND